MNNFVHKKYFKNHIMTSDFHLRSKLNKLTKQNVLTSFIFPLIDFNSGIHTTTHYSTWINADIRSAGNETSIAFEAYDDDST